MKQRELMKHLYRTHRGDRTKIIAAFTEAEERGEILRKSGRDKTSPRQYASDLFSDGMRKGWLREPV